MKLLQLTCDSPSFHTISFTREGLTLIVGDSSDDKSEGSSNGVGKTLALGLVHHCLGANADPRLKQSVPDWQFNLTFEMNGTAHSIQRSGDGRKVLLDNSTTTLTALRRWLDASGVFRLDPNVPLISFRSLVSRFARYRRDDCLEPLRTSHEQEFDSRLRSLYLLGLDTSLVATKRQLKLDLDAISRTLSDWQDDTVLREVFRAGAQPKVRAEWLDREIPRLRADRDRFEIAEDYRAIELEASALTSQLREIENQQAVLAFQSASIDKALAHHPDISKKDLLDLYSGLETIFKAETLAHFDAVEEFHESLSSNRRRRLEKDKAQIGATSRKLEVERQNIGALRDRKLQSIQGKRALDEYASLTHHIAALEEEHKRLHDYLNLSKTLQERAQKLRELKVEEDRIAASYVATNPVDRFDEQFRKLAEVMYPRVPAGIVIDNNVGDNQIRYNVAVRIEGDDSDGINAARILCFDWVLMMHGANHTMGFLWHDNRLFADIDPKSRANWFSFVSAALRGTGKQYIASLNTENYDAMKEYMSEEANQDITRSVALTLRGDRPEHKLLGVQFGRFD